MKNAAGRLADSAAACPYCGYSQTEEVPNALQPGWEIAGRYRIESVIGIGGFGITYRAYDKKLACTIALKEYFPSGITNRIPGSKEVILYAGKRTEEFQQGYARFLNEAQNMMQFHSVPNIVQVREYFEENGTAYIVMEYLRGHTLKTEIERARWSGNARSLSARSSVMRSLRCTGRESSTGTSARTTSSCATTVRSK